MISNATVIPDFSVARTLKSLIDKRDQRLVIFVLTLRLGLVFLDLAGLALLGTSATILANTAINPQSLTGWFIALINKLHLGQVYAVFACIAVVFFIAKGLLSIWLNAWLLRSIAKVEVRESVSAFSGMSEATLTATQRFSKHELSRGLLEGFEQSISRLVMAISIITSEVFLLVAVAIYLLITDYRLAIIFAAFFLLMALTMNFFVGRQTRQAADAIHKSSLQSEATVFETISNLRQLRSLGSQSFFISRFRNSRTEMALASAKLSSLTVLPRYVTEITLVLGFGALIILRSTFGDALFSTSTLTVFVAGSFRIISSLLPLQGASTMLKQIRANTGLTIAIHKELDLEKPGEKSTNEIKNYDIVIENLTFRHAGSQKPVINGMTEKIKFGEYVALVGPSGSGKSTIADLILGLREPASGTISIGGMHANFAAASNPGLIGYVPQDTALFTGSILENITLSIENSEVERRVASSLLKELGLSDLVESFPRGIDELIGGKGRDLSGGQRQRIGLARTLFKNPKILILDESTSALDSASEEAILNFLDNRRGQLTVLAIAHRGSVISRASRRINLLDHRRGEK